MSLRPKIIKRHAAEAIVLGEYECTGRGNYSKFYKPCHSLLEITRENLYITEYQQYYDDDNSVEQYTTFACPVCGNETDIDIIIDNLPSKKQFLERMKHDERVRYPDVSHIL